IGADVEQPGLERRFGDGADGVAVAGNAFLAVRQIVADQLPFVAAVDGLEEEVAAVIERLGIVRGQDEGRTPVEAIATATLAFAGAAGLDVLAASAFAAAPAERLQIDALQGAVLAFAIHRVRIVGIDGAVEAVGAVDAPPIVEGDAQGAARSAGSAPT